MNVAAMERCRREATQRLCAEAAAARREDSRDAPETPSATQVEPQATIGVVRLLGSPPKLTETRIVNTAKPFRSLSRRRGHITCPDAIVA
jgi:hypothetical protein